MSGITLKRRLSTDIPSPSAGKDTIFVDSVDGVAKLKDASGVVRVFPPFVAEDVQDAIGAMLTDSSTIDFTYDDGTGTLTAIVKTGSVTTAMLNFDVATQVEAQALADAAQTFAIQRANHTGTQLASTISDFTEAAQDAIGAAFADTATLDHVYDDASNTLKGNVLDSPTVAGQTPANLRDRATHTGSQLASTISDFTEATQDAVGAFVTDSATVDATYNDAGNLESLAVITPGLDYVVPGVPGTRGVMYGKDKKKLDSGYTDAVADLGCDPTGATDNKALIQAWHDALPATGGATLFLPDNCFIGLATAVALSKPDILIYSNNRRTSGFVLTSAANNGFTCSADNILFEKLRFIAGTPAGVSTLRTGGYAVEFTSAGDSDGCRECDFIYMWSGVHLGGSLQWTDECTYREYGANAPNGACVLVDGPGDRYIRRMLTDSTVPQSGHAGIRVVTAASLIIDSCNIIHAGFALDLAPGNGATIPSVEVVNTFFDTSVVGMNCTGAGNVLRSKFTNCWFGSMSDSGIKLGPTGTGTVDGMSFVNCEFVNNVGGTTVGVNMTGALIGKVRFVGCAIAGWTTGVVTSPGTNCWPVFQSCVVGGYGGFANNTTGFNVGAGAYKGLYIIGNECIDNTTPLTLGVVTVPSLNYTRYRITDNAGINPRGGVGTIAVPASGTARVNDTGFRVTVVQKFSVAATGFQVNGVVSVFPASTTAFFTTTLEPGSSITTTGGTYTWTWIGH